MATILIVDDQPELRGVIKRWLDGAGHEVGEADSAVAAIVALAQRPADVVFCDVQMPGAHDGLWLASEVRRRYHATAVILATGVSTVPPAISLQDGVVGYLVKPFVRGQLLTTLETAIAWHAKAETAGPKRPQIDGQLDRWLESVGDRLPPG